MEIPLSNGKVALISDEDYEKISKFNWRYDGRYATSRVSKTNPQKLYMHRLIMDAKTGELIDHKNGDRLDNQRENLRIANYQNNSANCKLHSHNTSGFKGVYRFNHGNKPWRAAITFNDKQLSLGYFDSPTDAAKAYNKKALELFGEYARLNVINETEAI